MFFYICSYIFMFLGGLVGFVFNRKHLLVMLLSLELIVLANYLNIYYYLSLFNYEMFFSMIYLVVSVCEGVLGLSILVSMIRVCGNDYMMSLVFLW